jgi:hypothetical protein
MLNRMSEFPHSRCQFRIEQFLLGREIATLWQISGCTAVHEAEQIGRIGFRIPFTAALPNSCAEWGPRELRERVEGE